MRVPIFNRKNGSRMIKDENFLIRGVVVTLNLWFNIVTYKLYELTLL